MDRPQASRWIGRSRESTEKVRKTPRNSPNIHNSTEQPECKSLIPNNWKTEDLICKQGVTGSIPVTSTNLLSVSHPDRAKRGTPPRSAPRASTRNTQGVCSAHRNKHCPKGQRKNLPVLPYRVGREVLVPALFRTKRQDNVRPSPRVLAFSREKKR